jgi:exosortase/archaeosortase family protein
MALVIQKIKTAIKQIPAPVKSFLLRALVFFLIWELAYNIFLLPNRVLDRLLSSFVANKTASLINILEGNRLAYCTTEGSFVYKDGERIFYEKAVVFLGPNRLIGIADACNGLNLSVLFIGFIVVFPSKIYVKLIYAIVGIVAIMLLNIARCAGLGLIHNSYPFLTDFAHHYVFKLLTYFAIFLMWYWFVKITNKREANYA